MAQNRLTTLFPFAISFLLTPSDANAEFFPDVGKWFEEKVTQPAVKGMDHLGKEIDKSVTQPVVKGMDHLGKEIDKAAFQPIGRGVVHFGKQIREGAEHFSIEFCDFMTAGGYRRGESTCGINAGVGVDKDGVYTYNPQAPDEKYRGTPIPPTGQRPRGTTPTTEQLEGLAQYMNSVLVVCKEDGLVHTSYRFGSPYPGLEYIPPTRSAQVRGFGEGKRGGAGGFLSERVDNEKGQLPMARLHAALDHVASPGETIYSPVHGYVRRIAIPKAGKPLRGVEINPGNGYTSKVFYVTPSQEILDACTFSGCSRPIPVRAGHTAIGTAQDIHCPGCYPGYIPNHVHGELHDAKGRRLSPDGTLVLAQAWKKTPLGKMRVGPPPKAP